MNIPEFNEIVESNDQTEARRAHLESLRELIGNVYPNKYERTKISGTEDSVSSVLNFAPVVEIIKEIEAHAAMLKEKERPNAELKETLNAKLKDFGSVAVAGRLTTPLRGNFVHLTDGKAKLQIYCKKGSFSLVKNDAEKSLDAENAWTAYNLLDQGDFVGASGYLFLTNTGELSVHVETLQFLAKALVPMPDKMHGISDPELQRRFRYADLIASSLQVEHEGLTTREVFERRAKLISGMRRYLDDHDFIEVETPMLTPKATGAAAKPFQTHHNALDITLYARIAPELYLKRLTVGGFEKVYELNRNFRNEGLSQKHNPEFTMLEFYCAYMDVNGMMDFAEAMIKESVQKATNGSLQVKYGWAQIDFSKFERLTMKDAIHRALSFNNDENTRKAVKEGYLPAEMVVTFSDLIGEEYDASWLDDIKKLRTLANLSVKRKSMFGEPTGERKYKLVGMTVEEGNAQRKKLKDTTRKLWQEAVAETQKTFDASKNQTEQAARDLVYIFEETVEDKLTQPTFITDYPKVISPLSKASPQNQQIAERFELFIAGMECANGFSELNDPQEQYERFVDQTKERTLGDEEAMVLDEDYIRALAYGMPPAAGIGIGIDRLVMLLTNKHSIRDVILFPHMRPEKNKNADGAEADENLLV